MDLAYGQRPKEKLSQVVAGTSRQADQVNKVKLGKMHLLCNLGQRGRKGKEKGNERKNRAADKPTLRIEARTWPCK